MSTTEDSTEWVPGYVPPLAMFLRRRVLVGVMGKRLDWADVYAAFSPTGCTPERFGQAMAWLCRQHGVKMLAEGGRVYALDCALLS